MFELALYYKATNDLFVNGIKIHNFKAKHSEIVRTPQCLGKISTDWLVHNITNSGLNCYFYEFMMLLQLMI